MPLRFYKIDFGVTYLINPLTNHVEIWYNVQNTKNQEETI